MIFIQTWCFIRKGWAPNSLPFTENGTSGPDMACSPTLKAEILLVSDSIKDGKSPCYHHTKLRYFAMSRREDEPWCDDSPSTLKYWARFCILWPSSKHNQTVKCAENQVRFYILYPSKALHGEYPLEISIPPITSNRIRDESVFLFPHSVSGLSVVEE